ncbi:ankyrin repeat and SAM domain-containing protein [Trichoderma gamsii]|uniref:Ankyrin repeat and SAM domain-containing protein n=1 Tax=Trichoderma gamsii TaxID=398673 RepID=A0A2P4Z911_9HYPO|nr:ankyrin repeat and SAM domain-containing protein [Trichoderma gamsii]PON20765.1 ankyrin repeat and SAM domain-containing protein [Trichoderma gamsii]
MISDYSSTLLWEAAHRSVSLDMLKLLLEAGSNVNYQGPKENTLLIEAVCAGNAAHVQQLVEWKADVKCRNDNGDTALSLAASQHSLDMVRILIEAKAPMNT